jgi:hypothetical protein
MKSISIRISADDEPIGAFTLNPYETVSLLAHARVNRKRTHTLAEHLHEMVRFAMFDCDEYDAELYAPDASDVLAVAVSDQKSKRLRQ